MNYVEQLIERGRREGHREGIREGTLRGRQEGKLKAQVQTIQGLVERDVPWSTIEGATGVDEATFRQLTQRLEAADDGADHSD